MPSFCMHLPRHASRCRFRLPISTEQHPPRRSSSSDHIHSCRPPPSLHRPRDPPCAVGSLRGLSLVSARSLGLGFRQPRNFANAHGADRPPKHTTLTDDIDPSDGLPLPIHATLMRLSVTCSSQKTTHVGILLPLSCFSWDRRVVEVSELTSEPLAIYYTTEYIHVRKPYMQLL